MGAAQIVQGSTEVKTSAYPSGDLHFSSTCLKFRQRSKKPWQFSTVLARWASDQWNLLACQENLLAPDYRTQVLLSPHTLLFLKLPITPRWKDFSSTPLPPSWIFHSEGEISESATPSHPISILHLSHFHFSSVGGMDSFWNYTIFTNSHPFPAY